MKLTEILEKNGACWGAIDWVKTNKYGPQRAWDRCSRDMWMFWCLMNVDDVEDSISKKAVNGIRKDLFVLLKETDKEVWRRLRGKGHKSLSHLDDLAEEIVMAAGHNSNNPSPTTRAICQIVRKHIPKVPMPKEGD